MKQLGQCISSPTRMPDCQETLGTADIRASVKRPSTVDEETGTGDFPTLRCSSEYKMCELAGGASAFADGKAMSTQ